MSRIHFSEESSNIRYAIAASFDMSGFSDFCRRPDAHAYINRYLANLFDLFDNAFQDPWRDFFKNTSRLIQVPRPDFSKYTGDGDLLLWLRDSGNEFTSEFCSSVVAALRYFQKQLPNKISEWEREWRADSFPKQARFGIATGPVYPLLTPNLTFLPDDIVDYAGYHVNLSVRLQDHCPTVGFIVHGPVHPKLDGMIQLKAVKMKGSLEEPVYVFGEDFERAKASVPTETRTKFALK